MDKRRVVKFIRHNPLFPFIPLVPIAMMVGSFVLSALALREARHARMAHA
jgi:hypothetical protein